MDNRIYDSEVDVAVLLIFFNRPQVLERTFKQIKKARPSKLFLYQDGARENRESDVELVEQCREIVSDIDWKCEVYKKFQDKNYGCDPSEYIAQKWVFGIVDKCIVIEDDDVANITFFKFCKELLDKYENDPRICRISGMNHLGSYSECPNSYFFTTSGAIWGWASWKRVIDEWDSGYSFLNDKYALRLLQKYCSSIKVNYNTFLHTCRWHYSKGKEYYESIYYSHRLLNSGLTIVPKENLITNIGLTADSTHASANIKTMPKGIQRVFNMKTYDMCFPLKHPKYIINDLYYVEQVNKIMGFSLPRRIYRKIEGLIRRAIFKG